MGIDSRSSSSIPSLTHQDSRQFYDDIYQHKWFRKLLLLMYLISLEVAILVLYLFPYAGFLNSLDPSFLYVCLGFGLLVFTNIQILWIFTIVCVWFHFANPFLQTYRIRWFLIELLCRFISRADKEWVWNCVVAILVIVAGGFGGTSQVIIYIVTLPIEIE